MSPFTSELDEHEAAALAAALPAYEIGGEVGRGAHGVVLAGRHRSLGRRVAIKQLPQAFGADPRARSRFIAEARVLASLDHPHIVEVYDFVDHEGVCLLVMERLTGGTLWSYLPAGGFTPDVSCALLLATCAGLHHAHKNGIVHRDVKPENLMFTGDGTLKVTDLGIAKVIGGASTLVSRGGDALGTPAYLSPEQARGGELTPATDVYQAGTLLFELLAGRLPFPIDCDLGTLLYRHAHESPPPLLDVAPGVPAQLATVTDRAIATSPADRYQSAEAFGVAIATCAAATWGPGWLARTNVPVAAGGPILAAALGEPARPTIATARDHDDAASEPVPAPPTIVVAQASSASVSQQGANSVLPDAPRLPARLVRRMLVAVAAAVVVLSVAGGAARFSSNRSASRATTRATLGDSVTSTAWRSLPPAPTPRQHAASTVWNGVAWMFGGLTNSGATTTVDGYDPAISTWESGPNLPRALHNEMAVVYRNQVVVIGGWIPNGAALDGVASNQVLTLRNGAWAQLPPLSHARAAAAAAVVDDKIVVAGGEANGQLVTQTEVFDGTRWIDAAPMPSPRDHLAGASDGRYFYTVGGRALSDNKTLGAVERYDAHTDRWTRLPSLRTPRSSLGATVAQNQLVAVGGASGSKVLDTVEALDLGSNKRSALPPMPTARQGLAVVSIGTTVFAIGGAGPQGEAGALANNEAIDVAPRAGKSPRVMASSATNAQPPVATLVPAQLAPTGPRLVSPGATRAPSPAPEPTATTATSTTSTSTTSTSTTSTTTTMPGLTFPLQPLQPRPSR